MLQMKYDRRCHLRENRGKENSLLMWILTIMVDFPILATPHHWKLRSYSHRRATMKTMKRLVN